MKYLILDYERPKSAQNLMSSAKSGAIIQLFMKTKLFHYYQKTKRYKQFQQNQKLKQLHLEKEDFSWEDMDIVRITLPMLPKELVNFPSDRIKELIWNTLHSLSDSSIYLLEAQDCLQVYVPPQIFSCGDKDEVYIRVMGDRIQKLCKYGYVRRRNARLLFLEDGSRDANTYIRELSRDWNFVSVYSERHEELVDLYRYLYDEYGLMVECVGPENIDSCRGDVVIDLTTEWRKIHRLYPADSYVLDVTFSHEKEKYLLIKHVRLKDYKQAANLFNDNS